MIRTLCTLLLVIPFIFFLPGAGLCGGKDVGNPNGMSQPISDKVSGTCRKIAAIFAEYPALEIRESEGPVRGRQDISDLSGCRLFAFGPASGVAGEIDPAEAVRGRFQGDGWTEDLRYSADGPGTTSFVFRKGRIMCGVSGGAHSWIEDGKTITSKRYELEAWCASNPL